MSGKSSEDFKHVWSLVNSMTEGLEQEQRREAFTSIATMFRQIRSNEEVTAHPNIPDELVTLVLKLKANSNEEFDSLIFDVWALSLSPSHTASSSARGANASPIFLANSEDIPQQAEPSAESHPIKDFEIEQTSQTSSQESSLSSGSPGKSTRKSKSGRTPLNGHDTSDTEVQNASLGLTSPPGKTQGADTLRGPDDGEAGVAGIAFSGLSINENEILKPPTLAGMARSEIQEGLSSENTALAGLEVVEEDETESPLETLQEEEHSEDMSSDDPGSANASHWSFLRFFHTDSEADTTVASARSPQGSS